MEVISVCLNVDGVAEAVERIRKPQASLLYPPPVVSESDSCLTNSDHVRALPEIKFTALLATAAIRIHAVVVGLSLEQAR